MQEIVVGVEDLAVERELDDRLRLVDRRELAFEIRVAQLLLGDVGCELDDLERLAAAVEDRIVAGLNPDFLAALADPLVLAGVELAAAELVPELLILGARRTPDRRTCCDAGP